MKLRISRGRITRRWFWRVMDDNRNYVSFGWLPTHAEALAVGLAALEAVTRTSPDRVYTFS